MKNLYIFRHGQTDLNVQNVWQGSQINAELNETGISQAKALKEKLISLEIEGIYSSPLCRALQTAILANPNPVATYIYPDLQECNFGVAEGLTFKKAEQRYPEIVYAMFHPTPDKWYKKFPGNASESKKEVFERVKIALANICRDTSFSKLGISTHAAVMSSLFAGLGYYSKPVPNCCVAHFTYDETTEDLRFVEML